MNEAIERLADLLRGGIVIEKDGENSVRIRLEDKPQAVEGNDEPSGHTGW